MAWTLSGSIRFFIASSTCARESWIAAQDHFAQRGAKGRRSDDLEQPRLGVQALREFD